MSLIVCTLDGRKVPPECPEYPVWVLHEFKRVVADEAVRRGFGGAVFDHHAALPAGPDEKLRTNITSAGKT